MLTIKCLFEQIIMLSAGTTVEDCYILRVRRRKCAVVELSWCPQSRGTPGSGRSKTTSVGINVDEMY